MKVGDLVIYSQEWRNENMYYEDEMVKQYGTRIIIQKLKDTGVGLYFISWSGDQWTTWEHETSLELISESW